MWQRLTSFFILVLFFSVAFAGPKLYNMWKDPEYKGKMKNVLVVGATKPGMRQIWENIFVYELDKRGIEATASFVLFAEKDGQLPEDLLRQKVSEGGYDGVILTTSQGLEEGKKYVPSYLAGSPVVYPSWYGGYGVYVGLTKQPGYEKDIANARLETSVWDTKTQPGKMIWAGTTEVVNVTSAVKISKDVVNSLIKELSGKKIL